MKKLLFAACAALVMAGMLFVSCKKKIVNNNYNESVCPTIGISFTVDSNSNIIMLDTNLFDGLDDSFIQDLETSLKKRENGKVYEITYYCYIHRDTTKKWWGRKIHAIQRCGYNAQQIATIEDIIKFEDNNNSWNNQIMNSKIIFLSHTMFPPSDWLLFYLNDDKQLEDTINAYCPCTINNIFFESITNYNRSKDKLHVDTLKLYRFNNTRLAAVSL